MKSRFLPLVPLLLIIGIVSPASAAERRAYRLGPGDSLAIVVHGVIGKLGSAPVHFPNGRDGTLPAMGYPIQVLKDGTLPLPQISPLQVTGLTVAETRDAIGRAYFDARVVNDPNIVMLTLLRKREIDVSVIHDSGGIIHSRAEKVRLPQEHASVLGALARTKSFDSKGQVSVLKPGLPDPSAPASQLTDGALIVVRSQRPHYYFTGGRLRGGSFPLPSHQPLTVVQAIAAAGGIQQHGLLPAHQVTIVRRNAPTVRVPLSQILNHSTQFVVQPGDHLMVR